MKGATTSLHPVRMPKMILLLLPAVLLLPLSPATSGTVVLAWTPYDASGEIPTYYVYGVTDGTPIHLGSTQLTTFVAPGGFPSYLVKAHTPAGEVEVSDVCIVYDPDGPSVALELDCP